MLYAQPQFGPLQIDTANPLTSALTALVVGANRLEAVSRKVASSTSGTFTSAAGKFGLARTFARASAAQDVYSEPGFSGDFTIFVVGGITGSIASTQQLVGLQAGSTTRFWLGENSNSNISLVTTPSGGSAVSIGSGGIGDAIYVGRLSGTTLTLWKNGVQVSTGTQTGSNWSDVTGLYIGNTAFLSNPGGNVYMAGFARRAWTDQEIANFSANPWQLVVDYDEEEEGLAPAAAGTIVTLDGSVFFDWSALRQVDALAPADFAAQKAIDAAARADWTATARADAAAPSEWVSSVAVNAAAPADFMATKKIDGQARTDWVASITGDSASRADWTASVRSDSASAVEFTASLRIDGPAPAEWTGQIQVAVDARAPLEWSAALGLDAKAQLDYVALQRLDVSVAAEFLLLRQVDATAPVQLLAGVQVDGVARADWTGAVLVSADARTPVEWAGGVLVTANSVMPLEYGAGVRADGQVQANWSAAVLVDHRIPADFNIGLIANQQAALEWLRSVFGDAVMPGETLAVIARDGAAPIGYDGASLFAPGNLEIFTVDQRGYIWRVETRGTVWVAAARDKVWFPEPR